MSPPRLGPFEADNTHAITGLQTPSAGDDFIQVNFDTDITGASFDSERWQININDNPEAVLSFEQAETNRVTVHFAAALGNADTVELIITDTDAVIFADLATLAVPVDIPTVVP